MGGFGVLGFWGFGETIAPHLFHYYYCPQMECHLSTILIGNNQQQFNSMMRIVLQMTKRRTNILTQATITTLEIIIEIYIICTYFHPLIYILLHLCPIILIFYYLICSYYLLLITCIIS